MERTCHKLRYAAVKFILLGILLSIPLPAAAANRPPIANAGPDQTLGIGALQIGGFMLDGTASFDPEFDPLSYRWYNSNGNLVADSSTAMQFRDVGRYVFTLVVDDGKGGTGSDSVTVEVILDTTAPLVIPPDDTPVSKTEAGGAKAKDSQTLAGFLAGGQGVDDLDLTLNRPPAQINGVEVNGDTLFPIGPTTVTFFFRDSSGNLGSATAVVSVVDLEDGDLFVGANNVIPYASTVGIIHHIRGATVTPWCQSASGYYPADSWAAPKELLVDSQGRVVFLAAMATVPGSGVPSWGLFRCSGPGLPIEHLAVYPRRPWAAAPRPWRPINGAGRCCPPNSGSTRPLPP